MWIGIHMGRDREHIGSKETVESLCMAREEIATRSFIDSAKDREELDADQTVGQYRRSTGSRQPAVEAVNKGFDLARRLSMVRA
jgi:hypothetical protein